jgi:hypothetical protein
MERKMTRKLRKHSIDVTYSGGMNNNEEEGKD